MHRVGNYDKASFQLPSTYKKHSQGYSRLTLVDHSVGSVHLGLGICKLDRGGTLNPHVHFYEEAFYILEGRVLGSIDGRNYQFGPGDYGIIQASVPHAWRGAGDQPASGLEMLSPQPKPSTHGFFNRGTVPVRWLETQAPQPPSQQAFRFPADWAYLAEKLDAQDSR